MIFDIIYTILFFILSFQFGKWILGEANEKYLKGLQYLIFFHFLMGVVFYFFTRNGGGDAWTYWLNAKNMSNEQFVYNIANELGTYFIEAINYLPVHYLQMSFFANTMFYAMLGSFGISCFYVATLKLIPYNSYVFGYIIFPIIFFLPNMHFWSAGVGKDTLIFMCVGMFIYAMLSPIKRIIWIVIAGILAFAVRPHIVLMMAVSFGFVYLFSKDLSLIKKVGFAIIFLAVGIAILPTVLSFVKVDDLSVSSISAKGETQSALLRVGSGSAVDISSYPLPLKILTFLFRPLFFDANTINAFLASIENLVLLILSVKAFSFRPIKTYRSAPALIKAMLIFFIVGAILFSSTLGNLGVMIRMRNMFLPGFLMYLLWAFSYRIFFEHQLKLQNKKK